MMNKFLFLTIPLNFSPHQLELNEKTFFTDFFKTHKEENNKQTSIVKLDNINGKILSNLVNKNNNNYLLVEIKNSIYLYTYDLINKKSSYNLLPINHPSPYKIAISDNYLCAINEAGNLNIINIISKKAIYKEDFLTPIYHPPIIKKTDEELNTYLLHGPDMVSKITIKNTNDTDTKKTIIHQQPYYNNIYYDYNHKIYKIEDYLIFPSKDGYIYVYEKDNFLWRKHFGDNFSPLFTIIYINNIPHIFGSNLFNGKVFLYNLKGEKIWSHKITTTVNNIYKNNYFIILDVKNHLHIINEKGFIVMEKDLYKLVKNKDKFSKIFNYIIINKEFIFFTDKGIYIFNEDLTNYRIINMYGSNRENKYFISNKNLYYLR